MKEDEKKYREGTWSAAVEISTLKMELCRETSVVEYLRSLINQIHLSKGAHVCGALGLKTYLKEECSYCKERKK